jgi:Domain of unknown function (DUF4112)
METPIEPTKPQDQAPQLETDPDLKFLNNLANLLDNKFVVPGTTWRFGLDGIIGLIPYVGDFAGFAVSGYLMTIMVKKGAGIGILLQMFGNMVIDALVGAIPFLGDLFDFGFKSNRRNVELLKEYYAKNPNRPNAYFSFGLLAFLLLVLFALLLVGVWKVSAWVMHLVIG